jgi:protein ImuB
MHALSDLRGRWLAIWLPHLATDRLRAERRAPPEASPTVCYAREGQAFRVSAVDAAAQRLGFAPGMALADVRAMHPGLTAFEADTAADHHFLDRIAAWCGRFSPVVALDLPDGLVLDVDGCAHLFGGEAALLADIRTRLKGRGVSAACAIAPTPAAAWGLARWKSGAIVDNADLAAAMAPLPVAALRIEPATAAFLAKAGLKRIGQLASAPRSAFAARAGEAALLQLDRALGRAQQAVTPRRPPPPVFAARRLMEPVFHAEALLDVATTLIADALAQLDKRNAGVRDGTVTFFGVDGADLAVPLRMSRPERAPRALLRIVREKLQTLPGWEDDDLAGAFGFEAARFDVHAFGALDDAAPTLTGGAEADAGARMTALIDVLSARLGAGAVVRPTLENAHWPEKTESWRAALQPADKTQHSSILPTDGAPRRPLTLLSPPQPVKTMAFAPDGPPVRFEWRRLMRVVRRAEGPERIAGDWLSGEATGRDYYRVEDVEGRRYWMFRVGEYGPASAADGGARWFVHGLFA